MLNKNKKCKYPNSIMSTQKSKKINNGSGSNDNQEEPQEPL
jgi:hypothetical protein